MAVGIMFQICFVVNFPVFLYYKCIVCFVVHITFFSKNWRWNWTCLQELFIAEICAKLQQFLSDWQLKNNQPHSPFPQKNVLSLKWWMVPCHCHALYWYLTAVHPMFGDDFCDRIFYVVYIQYNIYHDVLCMLFITHFSCRKLFNKMEVATQQW